MLLLDDGGRNASGGGAAAAAAYEAAIRAQLERALVARGYFGRATKVLWVDFSTYSPAVHSVTWTRLAFEARQFQKEMTRGRHIMRISPRHRREVTVERLACPSGRETAVSVGETGGGRALRSK